MRRGLLEHGGAGHDEALGGANGTRSGGVQLRAAQWGTRGQSENWGCISGLWDKLQWEEGRGAR